MLKESKEKELEAARARGDYQKATLLMAEVDDLAGPRLKRLRDDREATNRALQRITPA